MHGSKTPEYARKHGNNGRIRKQWNFWCSDEIDAGGGRETGNLFGVAK